MFTSKDVFVERLKGTITDTQKIFDALSDGSLSQTVSDGHRTLGRMAWHIVTTIPEMMNQTGLKVDFDEKAPVPPTAQAIKEAYRTVSAELLKQVQATWTDDTLKIVDELYGEKWQRGLTAYIVLAHEIHHRGQMTVLMRQAGLKVPGIYGPAKEEWTSYGMEAPSV